MHILTLGIVITDGDDNNYKYNFQPKIAMLKTTLNIWKQRKLSLKGKITLLNNLVLAPLIYVASVINTSKKAIAEINNIIQKDQCSYCNSIDDIPYIFMKCPKVLVFWN